MDFTSRVEAKAMEKNFLFSESDSFAFPSLMLRAASSIVLNLAEGYGKQTIQDRKKFFQISFGSTRECQAIFDLLDQPNHRDIISQLDHVAACTYKILHSDF